MIDKALNRIVTAIQAVLGIVILAMAAANIIQVTTRYFISMQVTWVEDFSMLGLYWIFGLGTPMCWIIKQHLNMNAFEEKMPPVMRRGLWILQNLLGIAGGFGLLYLGRRTIRINKGFVMSAMGFDESFRYYPLIACGILMIIVCVLLLAKDFVDHKNAKKEENK